MKKIVCIFITLGFIQVSFGQFASYQAKEHYDAIINSIVDQTTFENLIPDNNNGDFLGDRVSYVLASFLKMYNTTGDKAYLIRFISWSYKIQTIRNDIANSSNHPGWANIFSSGRSYGAMYQDGLIIMSMAEFVYLINNSSQLNSLQLPSASDLSLNHNDLFPTTSIATTYGDYAHWLGLKLENTLDYFFWGGYWDTNLGFKQYPTDTKAAPMNFQAGFAVALYYMGLNDPNYYYQNAVSILDNKYHGNIFCNSNSSPVFSDWLNNNSYSWYHNGWRTESNCGYTEDISHGIQDLFLPRILYNSPFSYNFTQADMIKLHNTFTENVYDGVGNFHNGVSGNDNDVYPGGCNCINSLNDYKMRALGWMPFYQFDDLANTLNVYEDIVMPFYTSQVYTNQSLVEAGLDYLGLSEVVAAQWDKECVNLTLYNRDVIYDQDFIVKNNLTIAPQQSDNFHQSGSNSYSDPENNNNEFIVELGTTVNFVAGESIVFGPGTHIKAGSNVHAYIDPNACTDGMRLANSSSGKNKSDNSTHTPVLSKDSTSQLKTSCIITPNPFNEITFINFTISEKSIATLKIIDQYGKVLFNEINNSQIEPGNYTVPFEGNNLTSGVYFCILQINGIPLKTQKIVLIK